MMPLGCAASAAMTSRADGRTARAARAGHRSGDRRAGRAPAPGGGDGPSARAAPARPRRPGSRSAAGGGCGTPRRAAAPTGRSPYQLSSTILASKPASSSARARPSGAPLAWITRSTSPRAASGQREVDPERRGDRRLARVDVDQLDRGSRHAREQRRGERADHAGADHRDPVADPGRRIPEAVERGLQVGGQHRARVRHGVRHRHHGARRHDVAILVRIEAEDPPADAAPARPRSTIPTEL